MKLCERLAELNENEYVYLGCKYQSWFIGTVKDAMVDVPQISRKYKAKYEEWYKAADRALSVYPRRLRTYQQSIEDAKELVAKGSESARRYLNELRKKEHNTSIALEEATRRKEYHGQILSEWVEFLDREVVDEYKRKWVAPLGLIITVKGREYGAYWLFEEYQRKPMKVSGDGE